MGLKEVVLRVMVVVVVVVVVWWLWYDTVISISLLYFHVLNLLKVVIVIVVVGGEWLWLTGLCGRMCKGAGECVWACESSAGAGSASGA